MTQLERDSDIFKNLVEGIKIFAVEVLGHVRRVKSLYIYIKSNHRYSPLNLILPIILRHRFVHGQFQQPSQRLLIAFPICLLILIFQKKIYLTAKSLYSLFWISSKCLIILLWLSSRFLLAILSASFSFRMSSPNLFI
jgi:hypothetical protein